MKKSLLLIGGLTAVAVVPISITTTLLIKKNKQQNINQNKIEKLQDELKLLQSQIVNLEKDKTQMAQYADSLIYGFDIENYQLESLEAMLKLKAKFHELNSYVDELKNQISIKKQNVAELEKEIKRLRNELNHERNAIRFEIQRLVTDEW
ncbi:IncA protein, partial [Metamycoplasma alkalescens]